MKAFWTSNFKRILEDGSAYLPAAWLIISHPPWLLMNWRGQCFSTNEDLRYEQQISATSRQNKRERQINFIDLKTEQSLLNVGVRKCHKTNEFCLFWNNYRFSVISIHTYQIVFLQSFQSSLENCSCNDSRSLAKQQIFAQTC